MNSTKAKIYFIMATSLFVACSNNDEGYKIGDVFDNSTANIYFTDTLTVNAHTILIDSFVTSGYNKVFLGMKTDDYLGKISAKSYIPLGISTSLSIGDEAIFDSLVLVLTPHGEYLGDTNVVRQLSVYEATDTIAPFDNGYFYNNTQFSLKSEPISTVNFKLRPSAAKKIYIKFPDTTGKEWFNLIISDDDIFSSTEDFQDFFKGIAIVPEATTDNWSATFMGFVESTETSNGLELRMYYSYPNEESNKYYSFVPSNSDYIFSSFESDPIGTVLEGLFDDVDIISSEETDNRIFLQSGSGLAVKIDIPMLERLNEIANNITILNAELIMKPDPKSYNSSDQLPTSINLYWTDKKNRVGDPLYDMAGENTITGTLNLDKEFHENTFYSVSILSYVFTEINREEYSDNDLMFLVSPEIFSTSFDRIVLMDNDIDKWSMQLRIYYVTN